MLKRIAFVTTSHMPFDDRIYYHFAASLARNGYIVSIICSTSEINSYNNLIEIKGFLDPSISKSSKADKISSLLQNFKPDIIICSEPLAIISSTKYKRRINKKVKIIYDITEWYPSKKNLFHIKGLKKPYTFIKLLLFNFYTSILVDGFIFGEYYKSIPFKIFIPLKKSIRVGYYFALEYIHYTKPKLIKNELCLGFSGKITAEKGIDNFLNVAENIKRKNPGLKLKLKIVGWFPSNQDENIYNERIKNLPEIEVELIGYQEFTKFSEIIKDVNIFFDLRETDFENNFCLPIKLFYYIACGRPVIYSDIRAIKKEIDITQFGFLVKPKQTGFVAECVMKYVNNPILYYRHCLNARKMAENTYNWKIIEPDFLNYIANL